MQSHFEEHLQRDIDQIREKMSGSVGSPTGKSGGGFNSSFDADEILDGML